MKKPSEMPREIDLFFFREGEVPMWEESPNGGIWIIKIKKEDNVNKMWESLLLSLISNPYPFNPFLQVSNSRSPV
jgi:Eukaryotic initiation factor 4E